MPVKKKKEPFNWEPIKKVVTYLIMSLFTAAGTYFGLDKVDKKEEVKKEVKIETPVTQISGNGNTNLNNSTINNNTTTNNINNTTTSNNTYVKREVIQPVKIIEKTEVIIEKENEEDDFGSVSSGSIVSKLEIRLKSVNEYSIGKNPPILIVDDNYPTLNLYQGQSCSPLLDNNNLVLIINNREFRSNPISYIGNGDKIILIEK